MSALPCPMSPASRLALNAMCFPLGDHENSPTVKSLPPVRRLAGLGTLSSLGTSTSHRCVMRSSPSLDLTSPSRSRRARRSGVSASSAVKAMLRRSGDQATLVAAGLLRQQQPTHKREQPRDAYHPIQRLHGSTPLNNDRSHLRSFLCFSPKTL